MTDGTDDRHSAGLPPAVETPSLEIELADEELLAELRTAAGRFDAVPPSVHDAALAAFELRNLDAELAELVADSAVEAGTVLVRGTAEPRLISFASPRISIELQVTAAAGGRRLVGQVVGQVVGRRHGVVELDHRDGVIWHILKYVTDHLVGQSRCAIQRRKDAERHVIIIVPIAPIVIISATAFIILK